MCSSPTGAPAVPARRDDARQEPPPSEIAVAVRHVGKCYEVYRRPLDRLKQTLWRGRQQFYREFWALRGVSFELRRGEALGVIGRNGSGKSTLLQIIAGTLRPSEGEVEIRGRVHALLELGAGFNPEFTGRENVYLNASILGLSRRDVEERFDHIAAFADIGDFLDQPIKTYSTGMVVRLAFAVQVQLEPNILIVDEALAVGDALFQKRCFQKLEELRARGVTLLFVSHDQESIRTLTSRALLLEGGRTRALGSSAEVVLEYRRLLHEYEQRYYEAVHALQAAAPAAPRPAPRRSDAFSFGDLDAVVEDVAVVDGAGQPATFFHPGQPLAIRITCQALKDLTHLNVAVRIRNKEGVKMYSWGTLNQDIAIWSGRARGAVFWERRFHAGERFTVELACDCPLGANFYEVQASVSEENDRYYQAQRVLHWKDEAAFFQVLVAAHEYFFGGVCDLRMRAHVRD